MSRWYIIHAYSGFENKVRDAIMSEATRMGLDRLVENVEVPTETVTEVRRGKKVQSERKFFPGYVLAKLEMNDDVYHLVKNTSKIKVDYEIGDQVKVLDGPFATFNGVVEELDFDRSRVKVSVSIFGRATPVELEFEQVERVK
jgi:transcriptional antiterminator NusG